MPADEHKINVVHTARSDRARVVAAMMIRHVAFDGEELPMLAPHGEVLDAAAYLAGMVIAAVIDQAPRLGVSIDEAVEMLIIGMQRR